MNYTKEQREAVYDILELIFAELDRREEELTVEMGDAPIMSQGELWAFFRRNELRSHHAFVVGLYSSIVADGARGN